MVAAFRSVLGAVVLFVLCGSVLGSSCYRSFSRQDFPNCQELSPGVFALHWRVEGGDIVLGLDVTTGRGSTAWASVGLSEVGGMIGTDFLVVYQESTNGNWTAGDFWSKAFDTPIKDDQQDVSLVGTPVYTDGKLLAVLKRKLRTCDLEDRPILDGVPQHTVWAFQVSRCYGRNCPTSWPHLSHGLKTRGNSMVTFRPAPAQGSGAPLGKLYNIDMRIGNNTVSAAQNSYMCQNFNLPTDTKYHALKVLPILSEGSQQYVHHIVLFGCPPGFQLDSSDSSYECSQMRSSECQAVISGWTPGSSGVISPPEAALPFGNCTNCWSALIMQMHYNNPQHVAGVVDDSGLRLVLTKNLRRYDMGMLTLGSLDLALPPQQGAVVTPPNVCPRDCTQGFTEPVTLVSSLFHMHYLGRTITTRHFRNGTELDPVGAINNWQFAYQGIQPVRPNKLLLPGDSLVTQCSYDTMSRMNMTTFGETSEHEMCFNFLLYYPMQPVSACLALPGRRSPSYTLCSSINAVLGNRNRTNTANMLFDLLMKRQILLTKNETVPPPPPLNCTPS